MSLEALREAGPSAEREGDALLGDQRMTLAPAAKPPSGMLLRVPWARRAERIAFVEEGRVWSVARQDARIVPGANLAGEERDTVVLEDAPVQVHRELDPDALAVRAVLVRVVLMAGALERAAAIALEHARERVQFGRPIGRFQAVQAHLVTIVQQAALVGVAADAAEHRGGMFELAAAKLLANRAAVIAGRAAHQVLGARGVTLEHPLSVETRRLWSWRAEYGSDRFWSERLGSAAVFAEADVLYPAITAGSAELEV